MNFQVLIENHFYSLKEGGREKKGRDEEEEKKEEERTRGRGGGRKGSGAAAFLARAPVNAGLSLHKPIFTLIVHYWRVGRKARHMEIMG